MNTFGERLKEERERLTLNQTAFGGLGGVQKQAQIKYEKNERQPDAAYLVAIASVGVDVLYLLTGMRNENVASTPDELGYLRHCRALSKINAQRRGLDVLKAFRLALGVDLEE
jgi:transcriptional regulator with XRE-family HTH domain